MPIRISALSSILGSPARILGIVLLLVFSVEVAVMLALPHVIPEFLGEIGKAVLDAILLTVVCAPLLWWVIIAPLRRIAVQEHQRSETIVANAGEGILTFNEDGQIDSCNRAGSELLGVAMRELIGKRVWNVIVDFPQNLAALPGEFRLNAIHPQAGLIPVQVSVSAYPSETGQRLWIAIIRDLTAALQAEQERLSMARQAEALRAQQMATLAQLATGVAHEIRNPLTSIKMLIQVNRNRFAEEGLPTDDLELVEHEIRRMERSVNSLLDYARPEQGDIKTFAVQDALSRTVQLIEGRCQSQHVKLIIEGNDVPACIEGDVAQIQQLLLNLSLNALDAMPEGGELTLSVSSNSSEVNVIVSDTGHGISPGIFSQLFTPFSTSKPNGVGLGLGICRRIAEAHQGTITGSNRITTGAQFRLTLPNVLHQAVDSTVSIPIEKSCKVC